MIRTHPYKYVPEPVKEGIDGAIVESIIVPASASSGDDVLLSDMVVLAGRTQGKITGVQVEGSDAAATWFSRARMHPDGAAVRIFCAAGKGGDEVEALLRYAERMRTDLVGISGVRERSWKHPLLNRTIKKVVSASLSPVWISGRSPLLPGNASSDQLRIICALDLQPDSEAIVLFADGLASALSARVDLAYVLPEITEASLADALLEPGRVFSSDAAGERLQALKELCKGRADSHLLHGSRAKALMRLAAAGERVLFVTGRRGLRIGHTTVQLLRRTPNPILVVPLHDDATARKA
jgi:hypothetical protein